MNAMELVRRHYAQAWGCDAAIFDGGNHVLEGEGFEAVGFGHGVVMRAGPEMVGWCSEHLMSVAPEMLFDGDHAYELDARLRRHGLMLQGTSTHYLLHRAVDLPMPEGIDCRLLTRPEVNDLQPGEDFPFAFNGDGSDVIALTAKKDGRLIALTSADDLWGDLWQIGIQVLPEARMSGLACGVVARLTREILNLGKTPFYSTWPGNLGSTRTALKCGFAPAWLSMKAIPFHSAQT